MLYTAGADPGGGGGGSRWGGRSVGDGGSRQGRIRGGGAVDPHGAAMGWDGGVRSGGTVGPGVADPLFWLGGFLHEGESVRSRLNPDTERRIREDRMDDA